MLLLYGVKNITLIEKGEVVTDDKLNAECFNAYFIDAVSSLAIRALLDEVGNELDPVKQQLKNSSTIQV